MMRFRSVSSEAYTLLITILYAVSLTANCVPFTSRISPRVASDCTVCAVEAAESSLYSSPCTICQSNSRSANPPKITTRSITQTIMRIFDESFFFSSLFALFCDNDPRLFALNILSLSLLSLNIAFLFFFIRMTSFPLFSAVLQIGSQILF